MLALTGQSSFAMHTSLILERLTRTINQYEIMKHMFM